MSTKDNKISKCNHGEKLLKAPYIIYADLEWLIIKQQSCQNNPNAFIVCEIKMISKYK